MIISGTTEDVQVPSIAPLVQTAPDVGIVAEAEPVVFAAEVLPPAALKVRSKLKRIPLQKIIDHRRTTLVNPQIR